MKYSKWIGLSAALLLIIASFLPWAYYPDLDKFFTGFFSEENRYGKPGKVLIFFALLCSIFILIPKIWAKRVNLFLGMLQFGYCVKSYILFSSCYKGTCPVKELGIYLMIGSSILLLLSVVLPDLRIRPVGNTQS
jgi:hypothetical protein